MKSQSIQFVRTLNEFKEEYITEYFGQYEYTKFIKDHGKIKFPKWIKPTMKDLVSGGFIDKLKDSESNYMVLWLNTMGKRKFDTDARKKELGDVGYKLTDMYWNDLTGYTAFAFEAGVAALEVSKHIKDMEANSEEIEPAYYLMKNYFNSFEMETKRSRIFDLAVKKLEAWMSDNEIQTL